MFLNNLIFYPNCCKHLLLLCFSSFSLRLRCASLKNNDDFFNNIQMDPPITLTDVIMHFAGDDEIECIESDSDDTDSSFDSD